MKYLYELVDLLNQYDGSNREMENRIRDLVCYILDSSEYMQIDLYRSIVFEAAQKLRMFGYIKGTNRIAQDEFFYDNLNLYFEFLFLVFFEYYFCSYCTFKKFDL